MKFREILCFEKNVLISVIFFSGQNSHRRFRSQTPFSTKTSYSTNTASHYSQFLDDDEEVTGIIEDYMKYGRSGRSKNKERLEHRVISSDHMPDTGVEG